MFTKYKTRTTTANNNNSKNSSSNSSRGNNNNSSTTVLAVHRCAVIFCPSKVILINNKFVGRIVSALDSYLYALVF